MFSRLNGQGLTLAVTLAATCVVGGDAVASTINQNTSWTINRSGATSTYRVVSYGDSIFAGYNGSLFSVAKRAAPLVEGEYLGKTLNSNFEMCGNDYLQARSSFTSQTGTCSYSGLDTALANCTTYTEKAMQAINQYATTAKVKVVMNLYYPGYNADNVATGCTDATTGTTVNKRAKFLPYLAKSNWRTCNLAEKYGFKCADAFAEFMAADYDSNGDGQLDADSIRYRSGETEAAYVTRVTSTYASLLRDSNTHLANASTSYDYLQSDDTHPTYYLGTIGTGSGSGAPDFTDAQIVNGQNPQWNKTGHERAGWSLSTYNPTTP
jgi:hypothetical protein